jgi:hypothetical protein
MSANMHVAKPHRQPCYLSASFTSVYATEGHHPFTVYTGQMRG